MIFLGGLNTKMNAISELMLSILSSQLEFDHVFISRQCKHLIEFEMSAATWKQLECESELVNPRSRLLKSLRLYAWTRERLKNLH
jgi:hypothetical protein